MATLKLGIALKKHCPNYKITKKNYKEIQKQISQEKKKLIKKCPGLYDVKVLPTASGVTIRPYVKIQFYLKNKKINSVVSIAKRKHMQYLMIVGKEDLTNFIIVPEKNDYNTQK